MSAAHVPLELQVVALILLRLPSEEALCAAGVSRSWRAAAGSLTSLHLSFSITLKTDNIKHSAPGWSRLLRCAASPAAAQIGEIDLSVQWHSEYMLWESEDELPADAIAFRSDWDSDCAASIAAVAAGISPRLRFPALQLLRVHFPDPLEVYGYQGSAVLTGLSTNLVGVLVHGCSQLQQLILTVQPQRVAETGFRPLHASTLYSQTLPSPLDRILSGADPALTTATVCEGNLSAHARFAACCAAASSQAWCSRRQRSLSIHARFRSCRLWRVHLNPGLQLKWTVRVHRLVRSSSLCTVLLRY